MENKIINKKKPEKNRNKIKIINGHHVMKYVIVNKEPKDINEIK